MLFLKRRYTCFKNNNLWIILNLLHALWIWANNFRKMIDRINNIPTFHSFPWLSRKKIKNRPVNNKLQLQLQLGFWEYLCSENQEITLRVISFEIFDYFRNHKIPAEFGILFFLIFDWSMILIPVSRISLFLATKLEFP